MVAPHGLGGIFVVPGKNRRLCTRSLAPGLSEFDEFIIREGSDEYRVWDPSRSKLAAALHLGCKDPGLRPGDVVMYLGASHGYTPSFVSDIIGKDGLIFALDFAPRVVRDAVFLAQRRSNIAPIMADAHHPERYAERACQVDWLYQDVAQKDQVDIFLKNIKWFLKGGGLACLALKARSVDVSKKPREVFAKVRQSLEKEVTILESVELDPLQKGHCFFVVKNERCVVPALDRLPVQKPSQLPVSKPKAGPAAISPKPAVSPKQASSDPSNPQHKRWLGQRSDPKYKNEASKVPKKGDRSASRFKIENL